MKLSHRLSAAGTLLTACLLLACDDTEQFHLGLVNAGGGPAGASGAAGSAGASAGTAGTDAGTAGDGGTAGTAGNAGQGGTAGNGGVGGAGSGGASGSSGATQSVCPTSVKGSLKQATWDRSFTIAGVSGQDGVVPTVYDLATDTDGSLLVAGYFRWTGATHADGFARWVGDHFEPADLALGSLEVPAGGFHAIAVSATTGVRAFAPSFGGSPVQGAIWIDDGQGIKEVGRYQGKVRRLTWVGDTLWVAGMFTLDGGGPTSLATWDGTAWHGAPGGDPDHVVLDVVADTDGSVLVAGQFAKIGGVDSPRIARWDGTAWSNELAMPEAQSARVLTLARDKAGQLHAGGLFSLDGSKSASLARWDGTAWQIVGGGVAKDIATGVVSQLLPDGDGFYVSGCFDRVQGSMDSPDAVAAVNIAHWDGTTWQAINDVSKPVASGWFDFGVCGFEPSPTVTWNMPQQRLLKHDGAVFVGGSFAGLGGVPSQSVTSYRDASWKAVGAAGNGVSGVITNVQGAGPACSLYGLASASHLGNTPVTSPLVRFEDGVTDGDPGHWTAVGTSLPKGVSCTRFAVDPASATPWLACANFLTDGITHLYRLNSNAWEVVAPELPPVNDLAFAPDGTLYVVGGADNGYVARWTGEEFANVGGVFDLVVLNLAFAPREGGYDVLATGPFTSTGSQQVKRVARWDGTQWNALGEGSENTPSAIAAGGGFIYLATQDEGQPGRKTLARWDGSTWTELADEAHGLPKPLEDTVHTFLSILPLDEGFLATGYVWPETGGRNVFHFDGTTFTSLVGGAAAIEVDNAALTQGGVWLSGTIAEVGQGGTLASSVGVARLKLKSSE